MSTIKYTRKEQTTMPQLPLDRDLHKKFKLNCLALDTTTAKQIERLMEDFLKGRVHGEET